jgi:hypothetical protein
MKILKIPRPQIKLKKRNNHIIIQSAEWQEEWERIQMEEAVA